MLCVLPALANFWWPISKGFFSPLNFIVFRVLLCGKFGLIEATPSVLQAEKQYTCTFYLLWKNTHKIYHFRHVKEYDSEAFNTFTELCNRYHYLIIECFLSLHRNSTPIISYSHSFSPRPWKPQICFLSLWICLFWMIFKNWILHMWPFVSGFFHPAELKTRLIHIVAWVSASWPFMTE